MSHDTLEDQGLEKNPNLELAHCKFLLTLREHSADETLHARITEAIKKNNMAPWYELVCKDVGWTVDKSILKKLKAQNTEEIKLLDLAIEDAENNLGEMEVRDAYLKKAEYYSLIGDKANAVESLKATYSKTLSLGHKVDVIFHLIRIGFFFMDHELIDKNIDQAKGLIEEGGDWDRRNRLKVYQGMYCIAIRDFKMAASLFLDTVSTFTSYELMDYKTFIRYTIYVSLISLPRNQLRDKIVKGSEIQEVLHTEPFVKAEAEAMLKCDYFFHPHYRFYIREMKILAYSQLLESYRSLTLQYMAESFGVSVKFIDMELSEFIALGRLNCKIDRVGGVVETSRPDSRNVQFNSVVKHGDLLLNRVQKLSRVINI